MNGILIRVFFSVFSHITFVYIVFLSLQSQAFAYDPTQDDAIFIKDTINLIATQAQSNQNPALYYVDRYYAFLGFSMRTDLPEDVSFRANTILTTLRTYIDTKKKSHRNNTFIDQFLSVYKKDITTADIALPSICFDNYTLVDDYAWGYNLPTALILATWKMEATCKFGPYNNGPFQIISYNYGEYEPTTRNFIQHIHDYVGFFQSKLARYHRSNDEIDNRIVLNYNTWSFDDLLSYTALYNGLSGNTIIAPIQPAQAQYFWGNYTQAYENAIKDGFFTVFLKFLLREKEGL